MLMLSAIAAATAAPLDTLDAGDVAWCAGDRRSAAEHWSQAAADGAPAAVRAMASARLLLTSGNLGLLRHGPRADAALASCPSTTPMCALARTDYELVLRWLGLPHDLDLARALAAQASAALPGRAQARRVLLGDATLSSLRDHDDRGGLGDGLLAAGGWPAGPGTWYLGVGVSGAPGLGVGGAVRLHHPDLAWRAWRLETTGALTTRGIGSAQAAVTSPGRAFATARTALRRWVLDDHETGETLTTWTVDAVAAPGLRGDQQAAWLGPMLRWDSQAAAHGAQTGGALWRGPLRLTALAEVSLLGPTHHRVDGALVGTWPLGRGTLAARLAAEEALGSDAPWWRQPTAGGGVHLRSAPAFRWRAPWLAATAAEWRHPIVGPLGAVAFAEAAWVDGLHPGVGAGLRLMLPPQPANTVRLDLGWGPEGLAVTAGWGQAF